MKPFVLPLMIAVFSLWAVVLALMIVYLVLAMRLLTKLKDLDHPLWLNQGSPAWSFKHQPANFREAWQGLQAQMRYCSWMLWKTKHPHPELNRRQTVVRRLFVVISLLFLLVFSLGLITFAIQALA